MDPGLIGPNAFIFYRVLSAALLFLLFFPSSWKLEKEDLPEMILCMVCGIAANQLLFFNGLHLTSPVHAALIMVCTPILVLILSYFEGTHLQKIQWLGCVLGLTGAAYLIASGAPAINRQASLKGDLMIFCNALFYGYYLIRVRRLIAKYDSFSVLKYMFLFSVIPIFLFALPELKYALFPLFGFQEWMAFGFVLLATTFLAYLLNAYALTHSSPELVSAYIYLQPLIGTLIAIAVKKDHWNGSYGLAGCLIFAGLYLSGKKKFQN